MGTDDAADAPRICVVLLAAGGGSRFTGATHKLLAPLGDTTAAMTPALASTVFERALDHARQAVDAPVLVVTGAVELPLPDDVVELPNPRWAEGQATSLQAAVAHARRLGCSHVVIGLADQPFVGPEAWRTVAEAPDPPETPIVVATYEGRRGNPVRLRRDVWGDLPSSGDEGARSLMRLRPHLVREVACAGSPADIDTLEDLRRWQSS